MKGAVRVLLLALAALAPPAGAQPPVEPRERPGSVQKSLDGSSERALPPSPEVRHAILSVAPLAQRAAFAGRDLKLATWNLEWLMTPGTYDALRPGCTPQQPSSDERAFPCTPGRPPVPRHSEADFRVLARYAAELAADVVALQEVDGPEAAGPVFGADYAVDCFVSRRHPQKTGFAIRKTIPYRCNPEVRALDVDGATRAGADVTLFPDTPNAIRLLSVHLKSGCFGQRLDRPSPACEGLRRQVPVLEAWIDARVRAGERFAVMGDFNRQLEKDARFAAGADEAQPLNLVAALSDDTPPGAVLVRSTDQAPFVRCSSEDRHDPSYIDGVLLGRSLATAASERIFVRQPYADDDARRFVLSDHCPTGISLRGVLR